MPNDHQETTATPEQSKNAHKFIIYSDIESFTPVTPKEGKEQQQLLLPQPSHEQLLVQSHLELVEDKENINPFTGERANIQLTDNRETTKVPLREIFHNQQQQPQLPCSPEENSIAQLSFPKAKTFR